MIGHRGHCLIRTDNLRCGPEARDPCKELRTHNDIGVHCEMRIVISNDHNIAAQTIKDGADQMILKTQFYPDLFAGKHTEDFPGIDRHVQ